MYNSEIETLATTLGQHLLKRGWIVTVAESCTGGGLSAAITSVAGSSQWFQQGFVVYSNDVKHQQLGVSDTLLKETGAVSGSAVVAMAQGALCKSQADLAIAVSGIAGPEGGSEDKPVGTVWVAWATRENKPLNHSYHFSGDRNQIRQQSIQQALQGVNVLLAKDTF